MERFLRFFHVDREILNDGMGRGESRRVDVQAVHLSLIGALVFYSVTQRSGTSGVPMSARSSCKPTLDVLYDSRSGTTWVSWTFLALCVAVTVPSLFFPALYDVFGGIEPRRYPWQLFTAVLEHGWPGFHGAFHLALNAILILECGAPCERLLGRARFVLLGLASTGANAAMQLTAEGVNGASLVVWAWGPSLFVAWRRALRTGAAAERIRNILIVMYGVVTVVMAIVPYASGWRGNPVVALLLGNRYHLTATAVGALCAWAWNRHIDRRLRTMEAAIDRVNS